MTHRPLEGKVEDEQTPKPELFDKDYVTSLRQESAKYRTQVRELESQLADYSRLEAQINAVRIENELIRRGISADPGWIAMREGEDPATAVDSFLERYPQLAVEIKAEEEKKKKNMPKSLPPQENKTNTPGPQAAGFLGDRSLEEIKKDPVARDTLRDVYRDMLRRNSHQGE